MFTVLIFIIVLSVLVFVHELGHFQVARWAKVKVSEFGFGFPPRLIGFYKTRQGKWTKVVGRTSYEELRAQVDKAPADSATIYSINAVPLGGFVNIKGENGEQVLAPDSFGSKSVGKRALILSAGVIMNVFLAWLLFSIGYLIGLPQSTTDLARGARVKDARVAILEVAPEMPASEAGLEADDFILRVNGQEVALETDVQFLVGQAVGTEVNLLISRAGEEQEVVVTPVENEVGQGVIGIGITAAGTVRYPLFRAIIEGARLTIWMLGQIFLAFGALIGSLFTGAKVGAAFAGPIGIATITGQAARLGFAYLLQFTALLSLNLAVINILPFPALDGGRILFLLLEKIKGKPVRAELEATFHNIGFILLLALVIFITYKDIIRLF